MLVIDYITVSGEGDVPTGNADAGRNARRRSLQAIWTKRWNVEGGTLTFTNDEVYPWEVRDNYAASGNAGVESSTSTVTTTVELAEGEALYFDWSTSSERTTIS